MRSRVSKKHQSRLIKLHMQILDPFDLRTVPEFFKNLRGEVPGELSPYLLAESEEIPLKVE